MATILLSAAGAAAGASIGGGVLGLSSLAIGRALGAGVGRAIDERLFGGGRRSVEQGRVDRFHIQSAGEGDPIAQIYGRMRSAGHVIWASNFRETATTSGGSGKGGSGSATTTQYSYSVSLALGLCEGEIIRIGRIWADGELIARDKLNLRVYTGTTGQLPDPKIEAVEGVGNAPAYRGTAYVVIEDLELAPFGNRLPQFNFEVIRPAQAGSPSQYGEMTHAIQSVALIPGSGEYALATTPVYYDTGIGKKTSANINSPSGKTDLLTSIEALVEELPNCGSTSLIVSWFCDDLRCNSASVQPKVEQNLTDGTGMPWVVSDADRVTAAAVPQDNGRVVYGGTPADAAVIEAIAELNAQSQKVVLYPFILMDQIAGNGLIDPWTGSAEQPALPWRGRITLSIAPGVAGTPDQTAAATTEVHTFFGSAQVADFSTVGGIVSYSGPAEWSYRRMVLHYAHLCAVAGGVDGFCIGSELRGLTRIRGAGNSFPAVDALKSLAADVRAVLGASVKIGYAADWSEYFGYHPQDGSGDVFFNLDELWAHPDIDFVGIDNYTPLSDWRDGDSHADASWGSIYNLDYLKANIEGGEGFDWYYHNDAAADAQVRTPITDGAYGEPWVFRYKDIRNWWTQEHYERLGGVRALSPTAWDPESKPIWFTEIGCATVDKASNQPNKFLDKKSSESSLPRYSNGRRDELIQMQFLGAVHEYWGDAQNNPSSSKYAGSMIATDRMYVWAWDTRPYPAFPTNIAVWSDGENYGTGHWLNGRTTSRTLAGVIAEICGRSGLSKFDVAGVYGLVRGYLAADARDGRAALQPLLLAHAVEAFERDGNLRFSMRDGRPVRTLVRDDLAIVPEQQTALEYERSSQGDTLGRVRVGFVDHDAEYQLGADEAALADETLDAISDVTIPLALARSEARAIAARILAEARVARDVVKFSLPPSLLEIGSGDVVEIDNGSDVSKYRIDQTTSGSEQLIEAVRVEPGVYIPPDPTQAGALPKPFIAPVPLSTVFLDLPLIAGDEIAHAPSVAIAAEPWPGGAAIYASPTDSNYALTKVVNAPAIMGVTETALASMRAGIIDRGAPLRVKLTGGPISSVTEFEVLSGKNYAAIGDGTKDNWEIFQFQTAVLVAEDTYELSLRLRGQVGSDALSDLAWPVGSTVVMLDGGLDQIDLGLAARGLTRNLRIGPFDRPFSDASYQHFVEAFDGNGLRPLAPVHLRWAKAGSGDVQIDWVRRTRIDGDNWQALDVPLSEEAELYLVRVAQSGSTIREEIPVAPTWIYTSAMQAADAVSGLVDVEVAQISSSFGPGLFRKVQINV